MRHKIFALFAATALSPVISTAQSADVLLNCTSCHQLAPSSDARLPSPYPDLRGQPARYLERQLHAYREGWRTHRQMQQTALSLGQGAAAMSRAYADAPAPELSFTKQESDHSTALELIEQGDWTRGIAPCASCHTTTPDNRARLAPRLHGQPARYTNAQLQAYADGTRQSDPMGRMRAFSAPLTPSEMTALADYYAAWTASDNSTEASNE